MYQCFHCLNNSVIWSGDFWFCKNAVNSYDESVRYEVKEVDVDDDEEE